MTQSAATAHTLDRVVGVPGAVLMGLGSILGTGIFVSIGLAAGVAGQALVPAIALAAVLAALNGLSSAQLAASHPVSGGAYEYGYRYLTPSLGFTAGWMFLCAKSASAASAALGLAGYALGLLGASTPGLRVVVALAAVAAAAVVVASGIGRSARVNAVIVAATLASLAAFVAAGAPIAIDRLGEATAREAWNAGPPADAAALLHAVALMFVAYTGYGRIATLGEEIRDPASSIPRAIVATLVCTAAIYVCVAAVAVAAGGAGTLADATSEAAPLAVIARSFGSAWVSPLVAAGAVAAMLGVLLNLVLGLSRVALAMVRRADLPVALGHIDAEQRSPRRAVIFVGLLVAALVASGSVALTWSFSAFTVLVYYAINNLAALRLRPPARRYPRVIPAAGLVGCLGLAFFVDAAIWIAGLGLIAVGLAARRALSAVDVRTTARS